LSSLLPLLRSLLHVADRARNGVSVTPASRRAQRLRGSTVQR
jgi:hypothetical protein